METYVSKKNISIVAGLIFSLFFFWTSYAHAFSVFVENPKGIIQKGDTVIVKFFVDTGNAEINVVEGSIGVQGDVTVKNIQTGGSIFGVWPAQPTYKDGKISFTGGSYSGVSGSKISLFNVALTVNETGNVSFDTANITSFLSNGSGTAIKAKAVNTIKIPVTPSSGTPRDDLAELLTNDTVSPQTFSIQYGKSEGVYEGKVFLSFITADSKSGIDYYEITEGDVTYTTKENTYVLRNQNYVGKVSVTAVDLAGNKTTESIVFGEKKSINYLFYCILLGIVGVFVWLKFFKNK